MRLPVCTIWRLSLSNPCSQWAKLVGGVQARPSRPHGRGFVPVALPWLEMNTLRFEVGHDLRQEAFACFPWLSHELPNSSIVLATCLN